MKSKSNTKNVLAFLVTFLSFQILIAQDRRITGFVKDDNGLPLETVSVTVEGGETGTFTDKFGKFTITSPTSTGNLVFSSVGYATQTIAINNRSEINVVLSLLGKELDDVVVVGYGRQKRENLTGAVDQIGSEYFEDRPTPNISRALQGAMPNLNLNFIDGKPIRNPTYNIRGLGSIGSGGNALVLIDGVESDPKNLNPNDIESVSILKDAASAAIYGARGTFGVVLITTKTPKKSTVRLDYSGNYSINKQTTMPHWISDGYTWAKMFNESYLSWTDYVQAPKTVGNFFPFSSAYLEELKKRSETPGDYSEVEVDPQTGKYVYYGNTDWLKLLYANQIPSMEHSVSASGGGDKTDFVVSGRYYKQDGIFRYNSDDFKSYNLRLKGGAQVTDWLKINANIDFSNLNYKYPLSSINKYDIWTNIKIQGFPIAVMFNPDGTLTRTGANTIGDFYYGKSNSIRTENQIRNTIGFDAFAIRKKVNIKGDFSYLITDREIVNKLVPLPFSESPGTSTSQGSNSLSSTNNKTDYYAANLYANYSWNFSSNNFKMLLGGNVESYRIKDLYVQRDGLLMPDLADFNLAVGEGFAITGGGNDWSTAGIFGRLNYDYQNKYLIELNARYDGSSKFPSSQAFGFFPSISAGWNIAKESFMQSTKNWLTNLKLRASYGSLGNGRISPYLFIESLDVLRSSVVMNGNYVTYIRQPAVVPDGLTWETSTTSNFGMDIDLFNNKFSSSFDIYSRKTTDMITAGQPLPSVFGASVPRGNFADLTTKGFELSLTWRDQINTTKPIRYSIKATLADNKSIIDKFYNPTNLISSYYVGKQVGEIWGYRAEGLFLSEDDIKQHADQSFIKVSSGNILLPGDLKFKDLNDDKKINNGKSTLDDHGDLTVIGNSSPRYTYGLTTDWSWNNISLFVFFQGVGKRDWWPSHESGIFWGQYTRWYGQIPEHTLKGTWTVDNPNPDSYFPRYRGPVTAAGRELGTPVDRYLQDVSYIRLKNLQLSYTLPAELSEKVNLKNVRIYFSGQNIWTYSSMFKLTRDIDPEVIDGSDPEIRSDMGDGAAYPMLKTFTVGLNLTL